MAAGNRGEGIEFLVVLRLDFPHVLAGSHAFLEVCAEVPDQLTIRICFA